MPMVRSAVDAQKLFSLSGYIVIRCGLGCIGYGELRFSSVVNLTLLLFHSISTTNDTNLSKVRFLGLDSDNLAVFSIWY